MIKVMIVDDHPVFLDSLGVVLSFEPDMEVIEKAPSGERALEILEKRYREVDILLMDYSLKLGMNGLETTQKVLSLYPSVKVIMLTSFEDGEIIGQMIETNASGYVLKDEPSAELRKAIRKVAAGNTHYGVEVMDAFVKYSLQNNNLNKGKGFTPREIEALELIVLESLSSKGIAEKMNIKESTVVTYRKSICKKLKVHNTAGLVREAIIQKIISVD